MIRCVNTLIMLSLVLCSIDGWSQGKKEIVEKKIPFSIECTLKNFKKKKAVVHIGWQEPWENHEFLKVDMADGKFKVTGEMSQPTLGHIRIVTYNDSMKAEQQFPWDCDAIEFFLCSGKTLITGSDSLATATIVSGCNEKKQFQEYSDALLPITRELDSINALWQLANSKKDSCMTTPLGYLYSLVLEKQYRLYQSTMLQYPSSHLSVQLLNAFVYQVKDRSRLNVALGLYHQLPAQLKLSPIAVAVKDRLDQKLYPVAGKPMQTAMLKTIDGNKTDIINYKGKVLLIDFWASWCYPCKKEFPGLLTLYEKYKDKGFEVIGVSIDANKSQWLQSIRINKLTWPQLIEEGPPYGGPASRAFRVQAIPAKFLVDKDGVIVAKDLPPDQLETKIISLLEEMQKK